MEEAPRLAVALVEDGDGIVDPGIEREFVVSTRVASDFLERVEGGVKDREPRPGLWVGPGPSSEAPDRRLAPLTTGY